MRDWPHAVYWNGIDQLPMAGVAVLEACAVGVPTVGTAVGHIAEWSPSASLATPVGDWSALGESIQRVLAEEDLRLYRVLRAAG